MNLDGWHDLFVASAGAAAALAGLIIVAMSVNIRQIIAIPSMPSRAGTSIAALVLIVVVSIAALIPVQAGWMLGLEALVFALVALAFAVDSTVRIATEGRQANIASRSSSAATNSAESNPAVAPTAQPRPLSNVIANGALSVLQVLPFIAGGVVLLVGGGTDTGLSWIATGILLVFIGAVVNAWVLLVEILR